MEERIIEHKISAMFPVLILKIPQLQEAKYMVNRVSVFKNPNMIQNTKTEDTQRQKYKQPGRKQR